MLSFPALSARDRSGVGARKQALLDDGGAPLVITYTAWIEKNPDTLPRPLQFLSWGFVVPGKTVLGIVVAGFIHFNRESMLG